METMDQRLQRVKSELQELQYLKFKDDYSSQLNQDVGKVGIVNGSVSPLAHVEVTVQGKKTKAMIDTGSSVNIITEDLFYEVGKTAKIPATELQPPDIRLRDFNHNPIPVVARVDLKVEVGDRSSSVPIYNVLGANLHNS